MIPTIGRYSLTACMAAVLWLCNGGISSRGLELVATAAAVVGAPATPVSYAGVARRTPVGVGSVGVGAPGVGATPGVGVGAPGAGATPAPGVNTPANQGGPVNRVGRR